MKLVSRYALVGIAALAAVTAVQWLRENKLLRGEVPDYLLGVLPNLCAAVAITFVLLSILADQMKLIEYRTARRWFLFAGAIAGVGLIGWEVVQLTSDNLIFDFNDIGATLAGLVLSAAVFHLLTPYTAEHPSP